MKEYEFTHNNIKYVTNFNRFRNAERDYYETERLGSNVMDKIRAEIVPATVTDVDFYADVNNVQRFTAKIDGKEFDSATGFVEEAVPASNAEEEYNFEADDTPAPAVEPAPEPVPAPKPEPAKVVEVPKPEPAPAPVIKPEPAKVVEVPKPAPAPVARVDISKPTTPPVARVDISKPVTKVDISKPAPEPIPKEVAAQEVIKEAPEEPEVFESAIQIEYTEEDEALRRKFSGLLRLSNIPWVNMLTIQEENINLKYCQETGWRYVGGYYVMDVILTGCRYIYEDATNTLSKLKL